MTSGARKPAAPSAHSQLELINRLHSALRAAIRIEDLHQIMMAALISDAGLGYDRAFLFRYDNRRQALIGSAGMGAVDVETDRAMRREIRQEGQWLLDRTNAFDAEAFLDRGDLVFQRGYMGLLAHAFWIDTIQKFEGCDLDHRVREIEIPCSADMLKDPESCVHRIAASDQPLDIMDLPRELDVLCGGLAEPPAVAAPLRAKRGLYGILFADMAFSAAPGRVPAAKFSLFDWFAQQASVALENAVLFSEQAQAYEQLQDIEALKSNFLSTISHELRTPLTAIVGFTQVLIAGRAGQPSDKQREFLQRINSHASHLGEVIEDLLEVAEDGAESSVVMDVEPVDPLAALNRVLPRLERRRKAKNAVITAPGEVESGAVPYVWADDKALERVLFHLLDNAVKFSSAAPRPTDGAVSQVEIRFQRKEPWFRIEIEDHGIGISEENLKMIFEGFYQVDNRLTRSYEGLGIGLALTKKLLTAMDGRIDVRSRLGEGSVFAVEFRIAHDEGESDAV